MVYRRVGKSGLREVGDLSECDQVCVNYTMFKMLVEMIDYHRQYKSKRGTVPRTPIIVNGLVDALDDDEVNATLMVGKTKVVGRQTFFVERNPEKLKKIMNKLDFNRK